MKLKYVLIAIVSLGLLGMLLIPAPAAVLAADNLAANGDLELGNANGWDTPNATIDSATVYQGNHSLKLTATSAYSSAAHKTIPVRKNATVTVSFYYRYESDPGSKLYHVYTYQGADTNGGSYSNADKSFATPTGCNSIDTWQQVSYTFNSGNYTAFTLKFCPGSNGSSACYIDNLVVTSEGGDQSEMAPYLTSFGTKMNRPENAASNLILQGGFENADGATWNTQSFNKGHVSLVADATAPEGEYSLYYNNSSDTAVWHTFPVAVERYTQYTFSAWVKAPRLSEKNNATATFGVVNAETGDFLVYEPYDGDGYGSASLSTKKMQLMATSPDDEWHLRSVTFYSGSHTTVYVAVYGAKSQLYLDDVALYKSSNGVEYVSPLRSDVIYDSTNASDKYCADEDSLIEGIYMTTNDAQVSWSDNPAWRNGFLSFADSGDSHGTVLKYTASSKTNLNLHYIDWIEVTPHTDYTLTMDVKRLSAGYGRIALLDDNVRSPEEFYVLSFTAVDSDWITYSIRFNSESFSRIGFAIVDGGGSAYIDEVRLFESKKGIAVEPTEKPEEAQPTLKPQATGTSVMEMSGGTQTVLNGAFENGMNSWDDYQGTKVTASAAHDGGFGAHLKGDGSWGALIEQRNVPVEDGKTYVLSFWYKVNQNGMNMTLYGGVTSHKYVTAWLSAGEWTQYIATVTVDGDTNLRLNFCGGGNGVAEDIYLDEVCLTSADATLGVAFLFEQEGFRIYADRTGRVVLDDATVIPYGDGESYRLLRMGAVMTNNGTVGKDAKKMTLDHANGYNVVDVPVVYLWGAAASGCQYAVRVTNVPSTCGDTIIYARPYYVFEKDGEEILVYGDIVYRSYNG